MPENQPLELLGLSSGEICRQLESWGEASFRGRQVYQALYFQRLADFSRMTTLSQPLRKKIREMASITFPKLHTLQRSLDGTIKYLFELSDGQKIESVFIPEPRRNTLCISTQVGCALDCRFCLTALLGFSRNLAPGEIVGQILAILNHQCGEQTVPALPKPANIVLMGMGEPLLNLPHVSKALTLMSDPEGMSISLRRITLSTVGIAPKLEELGKTPAIPKLAISLSATTNEVRNRLVPINRKYPIEALLEACRNFPLPPRARITFEYVLIEGINDTVEDARRLVRLLANLRAKVNLLPLNPGPLIDLKPSPPERIQRFQEILLSKGLTAHLRKPRGADIFAACGQLHRAIGTGKVQSEI